MQHFKKPDGSLHSFDAIYSGELITADMVPVSDQYLALLLTPPLDELKTMAQGRIDGYFETLYYRSVPNNAMAAEYDAAYMVARRWLDNQGEPAPERVKALAETYGATNLEAAQVVVTKWTQAQAVAFDLRGAARLRAKAAIRQAADAAGVAAAELAGRAAMEAVVYSV